MIKEGRKPSMDPVQERLRQSKAVWNKDVSAFINDLIHLKKLMNGWPNKFYKERSKIVNPIPADPTTIIGALVGDFQEIAQRGNSIVQQQVDYSKNRRKPQPKQLNLPLPPAGPKPPTEEPKPEVDLSKQLSLNLATKFEEKYELTAEGSNPLSRFLTKLKTRKSGFGSKAEENRLRISMLDDSLFTYRHIGKFQVQITKSGDKSIENAYKLMQEAWQRWSKIVREYNAHLAAHGKPSGPEMSDRVMQEETETPQVGRGPGKVENGKQLASPSAKTVLPKVMPKLSKIQSLITDFRTAYPYLNDLEPGILEPLAEAVNIWERLILENLTPEKTGVLPNIEWIFAQTVLALNNALGTSGRSLTGIVQQIEARKAEEEKARKKEEAKQKAASHNSVEELEVVAQAFLKKWLGKARHSVVPGKTSAVRLRLYDMSKVVRKDIDRIMDMLEKGFSEELTNSIAKVAQQMTQMRALTRSLHLTEKPGKTQGLPSGDFIG